MQADEWSVPTCLTAAKTGTSAVVPAPGRSGKDLAGRDFGLEEGRKEGGEGKALNWNIVRNN